MQRGIDGYGGLGAFGGGDDGELNVLRGIAGNVEAGDVGTFEAAGADGAFLGEGAAELSGERLR